MFAPSGGVGADPPYLRSVGTARGAGRVQEELGPSSRAKGADSPDKLEWLTERPLIRRPAARSQRASFALVMAFILFLLCCERVYLAAPPLQR